MTIKEKPYIEKYRPDKLDLIIGQEEIIKRLKIYVSSKNMPNLLFSGPPGCISGDSIIFTNKGLFTIKELFEENKKINDIKVACSNRNGEMIFKEIEEYFNLKDKDIIKIKTRFGYEIKCTPEHKIVHISKNGVLGFVEAKDININDSVPILYNANSFGENVRMRFDVNQKSLFDYDDYLKETFGNKRIGVIEYNSNNKGGNTGNALTYPFIMNEELAEFLGYFISEGNIDSNTIYITNTDKNLNERIDYLFGKVFNVTPIVSKEKRINNDDFGRHIGSVGLTEFLNKLDLNKKSNEKHIPIEILRSSKEVHVKFLNALYSGDGYITKGSRSVGYSSMSKKLCYYVHLMLLNLGIFSSLCEKDAYCNDKYCGKTYDVLIQGKDVLKFKDIIEFTLEYRQYDLNILCKEIEEKGSYNKRTLKNLELYIEKIYEEFKKLGSWNDIREYYLDEGVKSYRCYTAKDALINRGEKDINSYAKGKKYPTKEKLHKILLSMKECSYMDEYKYLMNLCEMNVDYDIVESIEYGKEDVYDISIKDLHHYIANGFIVHNSGKTTAAIAMAKELYGQNWQMNFTEINASVSKNTPILIRIDKNRIERVDFQYLDKYYDENIKNIEVLTIGKDLKVKWSNITKLIKHNVEKLLRVFFEGGTLEITGNHSVIVFNDEGELITKSVKELKIGDYLISFCNNLEDKNTIEETKSMISLDTDKSWLYGMYRSEGCLSKYHVIFCLGSHEREYINRIKNIAETKLGINTSEVLEESGFGRLNNEYRLSETQVNLFGASNVSFFRNLFYEKNGYIHTAHTKRVPFFMFGQSLENKLSYLKGDYEGDGSDMYKNGEVYGSNFRITSVSKNSLIDIAWLGRTSNLHTSVYPENNVVHLLKNSFKDNLIPANLVINILKKISRNILSYNWRYDLRHILYKRKDGFENNRITKEALYNIMNNIEMPKFQNTLCSYLDTSDGIKTYELSENFFVKKLRNIIDSDLHVVEIKKIECVNYNDFVYDVSVPENQMFFAGDIPILLHNSDERGIDVVRHKIKLYAAVKSIGDVDFKIVFLDEADALTNDAQSALRRTMEKFTSSCRFILSCNYSSKIIEPIQSRCSIYKFKRITQNKIIEQCKYIANKENLKIESKALEAIAYTSEGDCRKAIGILDSSRLIIENNTITVKDIYNVASYIDSKILIDIIKKALSNEFFSSLEIMENLLIVEGISSDDIIKQLMKHALELNIPNKMVIVELVDIIGETDWRISEGANELIMLKQMIAKMVKLGSLI